MSECRMDDCNGKCGFKHPTLLEDEVGWTRRKLREIEELVDAFKEELRTRAV